MNVLPGATGVKTVYLTDVSNNPIDADTTPTATLSHNGADDPAVTVTVGRTTPSILGRYTLTFTIPSGYPVGDTAELLMTATIGGQVVNQNIEEISVVSVSSISGFTKPSLPPPTLTRAQATAFLAQGNGITYNGVQYMSPADLPPDFV